MKYAKLIKEKLIPYILEEDNRWTVYYDKEMNDITFSKFSPAGQDFSFTVECGNEICDMYRNIDRYFECFDVSEETYYWLDNTGHGKNGAPYEMIDVYRDMQECEQYIYDMVCIVGNFADEIGS